MILCTDKTKNFTKRFLYALFPSWYSFFVTIFHVFLIIFFLFKHYKEPSFDIYLFSSLIIMFVLCFILIIRPFAISKKQIIAIERDEDIFSIDYLVYNRFETIKIPAHALTYNLIETPSTSTIFNLGNRMVFYNGNKKQIVQFDQKTWQLKTMKDLAILLKKEGIKRPYGNNL